MFRFFFDCYDAHQHLHSFPTRRSSDLVAQINAVPASEAVKPFVPGPDAVRFRPASGPGTRSEEHTSELQSRVELVCRLLVAKKKRLEPPSGAAQPSPSPRPSKAALP